MSRFAAPLVALLLVLTAGPVPAGAGERAAAPPDGRVTVRATPSDAAIASRATVVDGATAPPAAPSDGQAVVPEPDPVVGPPEPVNNSTARLVISGKRLRRTGTARQAPDLAAVLSFGSGAVHWRHRVGTLRLRLETADDERRRRVVDRLLGLFENRSASLLRRQRTAIWAYASGTIDGAELLRRLAAIHVEADRLLDSLSDTDLAAGADDRTEARVKRVRSKLLALKGPVRKRVADALAARGRLPPVHVEASRNAVVLATVDDGSYVRETYFAGHRRYTGQVRVESTATALNRYFDYYPWALGSSGGFLLEDIANDSFRLRVNHPRGTLVSFLDAHTGRIYSERHVLELSSVRSREFRNVSASGVRVVLNRTYRGGPMRVEVYDAGTMAPLDATVALGNRTAVGTGTDGVAWFVEPRAAYEVTVTGGDAVVNVSVAAPT